MLDRAILNALSTVLTGAARQLHRANVRADQITLLGFAVGLCALPLLAAEHYGAALAFILLNRIADGLDGALARLSQPTDRGAFLDICFDFVFYASIPLGFALADPRVNALPAAVLLFGFMGTAASFLAYAAIAAKQGITSTRYPNKSIYYLGGLTEGTETLIVFVLCCLLPQWFAYIAWSFAALCGLTTAFRLYAGWIAFSRSKNE
jgi:phosphatidylglycerophosphate synthase